MTEPLTDEQRDAIRKRVDAATAGPWHHANADPCHWIKDSQARKIAYVGNKGIVFAAHPDTSYKANADFIAHSPADVLVLLDEVERLKADNKELEDLFDLQRSRMGKAVEFWRKSTGRHDVSPDLGGLLTFLLEEIEGLRRMLIHASPHL